MQYSHSIMWQWGVTPALEKTPWCGWKAEMRWTHGPIDYPTCCAGDESNRWLTESMLFLWWRKMGLTALCHSKTEVSQFDVYPMPQVHSWRSSNSNLKLGTVVQSGTEPCNDPQTLFPLCIRWGSCSGRHATKPHYTSKLFCSTMYNMTAIQQQSSTFLNASVSKFTLDKQRAHNKFQNIKHPSVLGAIHTGSHPYWEECHSQTLSWGQTRPLCNSMFRWAWTCNSSSDQSIQNITQTQSHCCVCVTVIALLDMRPGGELSCDFISTNYQNLFGFMIWWRPWGRNISIFVGQMKWSYWDLSTILCYDKTPGKTPHCNKKWSCVAITYIYTSLNICHANHLLPSCTSRQRQP